MKFWNYDLDKSKKRQTSIQTKSETCIFVKDKSDSFFKGKVFVILMHKNECRKGKVNGMKMTMIYEKIFLQYFFMRKNIKMILVGVFEVSCCILKSGI